MSSSTVTSSSSYSSYSPAPKAKRVTFKELLEKEGSQSSIKEAVRFAPSSSLNPKNTQYSSIGKAIDDAYKAAAKDPKSRPEDTALLVMGMIAEAGFPIV